MGKKDEKDEGFDQEKILLSGQRSSRLAKT